LTEAIGDALLIVNDKYAQRIGIGLGHRRGYWRCST
jgi:hypothetical protein